jgi:hypothetical protein
MLAAMLLACGSLASVATPAHAQQDSHTLLAVEASANPVVVDSLEFRGGTMGDLIESLRKAFAAEDRPFNAILRRNAANIPVGPLSLKRVTPGAAIQVSVDQWGQWTEVDGGEMVDRYRGFEVVQGPYGEPVYVLDGWEMRRPRQMISAEAPVEVYVIPLGDAIGLPMGLGPEERRARLKSVMSAVDAAVKFAGREGVETLVHEETMLLFVRGPKGEVESIRPVLEQAISEVARQAFQQGPAESGSTLRNQYRDVWYRLEQQQTEFKSANEQVERTRALRDRGQASDQEIASAELEVAQSRIEISMLRDKLQDVMRQMSERGVDLPDLGKNPWTDLDEVTPEDLKAWFSLLEAERLRRWNERADQRTSQEQRSRIRTPNPDPQ